MPTKTLACWVLCAALIALGARPREDMRTVQAAYRDSLVTLAAGDREVALAALVEAEVRALGEHPDQEAIERVWRWKLRLIGELLEGGSSELLVPIATLHHDAYQQYARAGLPALARHSRVMAAELADVYVERSAEAAAPRIAANLLTSLGGHLQAGWAPAPAQELFERAVELNPENALAHLGIAANLEKHGRYAEALPWFDRALSLDPDNLEAWLRGCLCLRRADRLELAESKLHYLIDRQPPEWILALAYQELVSMQIASRRNDDALSTIEEGLGELPGNQQLLTQKILILDRAGRRAEADRALRSIAPGSSTAVGAREKYNHWPEAWFAPVRQSVRAAAESTLPHLAAAVAPETAHAEE